MKSVFSHKYQTLRRCMIVARKEAQVTQESLAKSLKKPQSFVAKYETCTSSSGSDCFRLPSCDSARHS